MLLELALWLGKDARFFNVFGYITLRTMLSRRRTQHSAQLGSKSLAQIAYCPGARDPLA